ncbi:hypothetical protein IWQ57_006927, partial [Coemansia nantahalensis]
MAFCIHFGQAPGTGATASGASVWRTESRRRRWSSASVTASRMRRNCSAAGPSSPPSPASVGLSAASMRLFRSSTYALDLF